MTGAVKFDPPICVTCGTTMVPDTDFGGYLCPAGSCEAIEVALLGQREARRVRRDQLHSQLDPPLG